MDLELHNPTHQSNGHAPLPGTWKLAPGQALTLRPEQAGWLEIAYGELWATFDGPHAGPANDLGDHVIRAGDRMLLASGQRLVIESWRAEAPAYFSWNPLPMPAVARPLVGAWPRSVEDPLRETTKTQRPLAGLAARVAAWLGRLTAGHAARRPGGPNWSSPHRC